jgi:hypothetical protein
MRNCVVFLLESEARLTAASSRIPVQIAQEHLVERSKESLDPAAAPRLARDRKHEPHLEVGGDLLQVFRSEVRATIGIQNPGNPGEPLSRGGRWSEPAPIAALLSHIEDRLEYL